MNASSLNNISTLYLLLKNPVVSVYYVTHQKFHNYSMTCPIVCALNRCKTNLFPSTRAAGNDLLVLCDCEISLDMTNT